jgi:predicted adenylyl cyclase CyaB
MIEIELKFKITDFLLMISVLQKEGFIISRPFKLEETVMYDNDAGLMQETDGRIRVRTISAKDSVHKSAEVSYKKPITREGIKKEIEYEFETDDPHSVVAIFNEMGFTETTSYERFRTTLLQGNIKATVDDFPHASYLELEGPEDEIVATAKRLGFFMKDNLTKSCDTLFQEWRKERGLPPKDHISFEDYDK